MYEIFVNTKFKRPKYSVLDNNHFNDFNIKLVRKVLSKKGLKYRTAEQSKNYNSFITHLKRLTKEDLVAMMTLLTLEKYLKK